MHISLPSKRRAAGQIFLKVKARGQATEATRRIKLSEADAILRLPLTPVPPTQFALQTRQGADAPSPIWCVAIEVMIPDSTARDGPLLTVYGGAADDRRQAALTLSLRDNHVDVSLTTASQSMRIFRDPRAFLVGTWQRFRLAVRFGSEQYGLAQLLHEEVLVANYTGPLG